MTGEEFTQLWKNTELRQYILDEAKRRNRLPQLQEEYCQEAWMLISCAPAVKQIEYMPTDEERKEAANILHGLLEKLETRQVEYAKERGENVKKL